MSCHAWVLMVGKARRTFYLKKIAHLFGMYIVWLIEQDRENGLDALHLPCEKDHRKLMKTEASKSE